MHPATVPSAGAGGWGWRAAVPDWLLRRQCCRCRLSEASLCVSRALRDVAAADPCTACAPPPWAEQVRQEDLERHDGVSSGKYTVGLGQQGLSFVGDREDAVSMALSVLRRLLERHNISPLEVRTGRPAGGRGERCWVAKRRRSWTAWRGQGEPGGWCRGDAMTPRRTAGDLLVMICATRRGVRACAQVGRLEVGTETSVDSSKSIKSYLMVMFEEAGNTDVEVCGCRVVVVVVVVGQWWGGEAVVRLR